MSQNNTADKAITPNCEFGIYKLTSKWSDSKSGIENGRYDGHFTVYLHMGGANLNWDIKPEDFTNVKVVLREMGIVCDNIVNAAMGTHNSMTFQYVRKSQTEKLFDAIKQVLIKRLKP